MDSTYLKMITQLGYVVINNEDISKINIINHYGHTLKSDCRYIDNIPQSKTFYREDGREIKMLNYPFITTRINSVLNVALYRCQYYDCISPSSNINYSDSFHIDVDTNNKKYSIIIEIFNTKDNNDLIEANIIQRLDNKSWYNNFERVCDKKIINLSMDHLNVNYYVDTIINYIKSIDDLSNNLDVKKALQVILPSMITLINNSLKKTKTNTSNDNGNVYHKY